MEFISVSLDKVTRTHREGHKDIKDPDGEVLFQCDTGEIVREIFLCMLVERHLNNMQRNCPTVSFLFLKETKCYSMLFIREQDNRQCLKKREKCTNAAQAQQEL